MTRRQRGQALPEFAMVVPIMLLCILGAIDLARVVWANTDLAHAAREGARVAIVHGGTWTNPCPVGPAATTATVPAPSASCPYPSPSKQSIVNRAREHIVGPLTNINVSVCYGAGCTGDTNVTGATNAPGTEVSVVISGRVDLIVTRLLGMNSFDLTSKATMIISR